MNPFDSRHLASASIRHLATTCSDVEMRVTEILHDGSPPDIFPLLPDIAALPNLKVAEIRARCKDAWKARFPAAEFDRALKEARGARNTDEPAGSMEPAAPIVPYSLPTDNSEKLYPNDIARMILAQRRLLVSEAGLVYEYNGTSWERIPESLLRAYAMTADSHQYTKQSRRTEVVSYLMDSALNRNVPWRNLAPAEVPAANGVVNVLTGALRPHRPEDYLETVVPHEYDSRCIAPTWEQCLRTWFHGDADATSKVLALQEFFGYCLLPHARYKKALFLYGESDTGKSQVPLILGLLVGAKNKCSLSTDQMADERKRAPIVGKMVNLLTELPADAMIADGGFKQLVSTGDPISIDPKFKDPFDYQPFCKHVICTNSLPTINDLSRGTFNRLLLIQFNHVIPRAKQDKNLLDKLEGELQGILSWSISGARRLIEQNGEFTAIEESTATVEEYRQDSNPVNEFMAEKCEAHESASIPMSELREKFGTWAGRKYGPKQVTSMLKSAGHKVAVDWDQAAQRPVRALQGWRWRGGLY